MIKASGRANLFLINPNGIIFGENARLDIGGSFVATGADNMKFASASEFPCLSSCPAKIYKVGANTFIKSDLGLLTFKA